MRLPWFRALNVRSKPLNGDFKGVWQQYLG